MVASAPSMIGCLFARRPGVSRRLAGSGDPDGHRTSAEPVDPADQSRAGQHDEQDGHKGNGG